MVAFIPEGIAGQLLFSFYRLASGTTRPSMPDLLSSCERETINGFLVNPTEEAYQRLFRVISPQVLGYFRVRGCDQSLGEDLTQEVMATVYTESRHLRDHELFRAWLFRVARNQWLQHRRREQRRVPTTELNEASERASGKERDPLLEPSFAEWLAWLRPDERRLIVLRFVEGLEYHEIASTLDMAMGTVQWKIFQAKRKLADHFGVRGSALATPAK